MIRFLTFAGALLLALPTAGVALYAAAGPAMVLTSIA